MLWAMFCWESLGPVIHVAISSASIRPCFRPQSPFHGCFILSTSDLFQQEIPPELSFQIPPLFPHNSQDLNVLS